MPNVSLAVGMAGTQDAGFGDVVQGGEQEGAGGQAVMIEARYRGRFIDARQVTAIGRRSAVGPPALFAGGIALVLGALALFFLTVRDSAADEQALTRYLAGGGDRGHFVAPVHGSARDVLALFAAAGGLALVGLAWWRRGQRSRYVLGASRDADAPVAPAYTGGRPFALVEAGEQGCVVNVTPAMTGEIMLGHKVAVPLPLWVQQRGSSFALPAEAQARLVCGDVELVLSPTVRARSLRPPALQLRWNEQGYTAATAVGLLVGLAVIATVPPDARALSLDDLAGSTRFAISNIMPPEPKEPPKLPGAAGGTESMAAKGLEGALGKEHPKQRNGRIAIAGRAHEQQVANARPLTEEDITTGGLLGVIKQAENGFLSDVLGKRTIGADAVTVLGGLNNNAIGEAYGIGGLGIHGTGAGGGGPGDGTIGQGRFNTIGRGRGDCVGADCGTGYNRLAGDLGPRREHLVLPPVTGIGDVHGQLDKEIIRRIIRQHINEVKYCYEQQLVANPQLNGKISVTFTIAGTGEVIASLLAGSTMSNLRVEGCIVQAVRRWRFPSPQNKGLVIATYPFSFTPAGGH
jgi:hypothetical protein